MSRRKTVHPGGWVRCAPLVGEWGRTAGDPACMICRRLSCAPAWLHFDRRVFVCDRCMGDIWKNGEATSRAVVGLLGGGD